MFTEDAILKALDKPKTLYGLLQAVSPGGSQEALQVFLMKMRDAGTLHFDINKGRWRKA